MSAVEAALGPEGLHRALAHPENLPDAEELADPQRWLARTSDDLDVPDDASALFGELGEAPVEASADERAEPELGTGEPGAGDDGSGDGEPGDGGSGRGDTSGGDDGQPGPGDDENGPDDPR